jgi:small subunit ribosomal protein S4
MKIGPKFKIARRLGAPIFEKTQTSKFKANQERKSRQGRSRGRSDFGHQLVEKQKAKFSYGVSERQFGNYVKKIIEKKNQTAPQEKLYEALERRLDNVVYRLGLAKTRMAARQMVSHGHITLNERRVTVPSISVSVGDKIGIRGGSQSKGLFSHLEEKEGQVETPAWLKFDAGKKIGTVESLPKMEQNLLFDLSAVLEFYKR